MVPLVNKLEIAPQDAEEGEKCLRSDECLCEGIRPGHLHDGWQSFDVQILRKSREQRKEKL